MESRVLGEEDNEFVPHVVLVAHSWIIDFAHYVCSVFWGDIGTHIQVQDIHTSYLLV